MKGFTYGLYTKQHQPAKNMDMTFSMKPRIAYKWIRFCLAGTLTSWRCAIISSLAIYFSEISLRPLGKLGQCSQDELAVRVERLCLCMFCKVLFSKLVTMSEVLSCQNLRRKHVKYSIFVCFSQYIWHIYMYVCFLHVPYSIMFLSTIFMLCSVLSIVLSMFESFYCSIRFSIFLHLYLFHEIPWTAGVF